jgi:two-component system, cell cycle response regulator
LATASDGFEAGLQVATFKPHLVLLDLLMPHIDGFEVCRLIRANPATAHTRILIITAFGRYENIQRALKAGADDFLHKPLELEQLKSKVSSLLAED